MESETLVNITVSTKYGVDVYSSKIIDQYNFYTQTLRESGIDIIFKYNDGEQDVFNINDLLDTMEPSSNDHTHYFLELYGRDFNSSSKFKIFDMIDEAYQTKYGYCIKDGPVFQKYNDLFRKIKIVERQMADIWKQFNARSRTKIAQHSYGDKIDECYNLLKEPHKNDKTIIENLENIMKGYRQIQLEEKAEKQKEDELKRKQEEAELKKDLTICKNKFGQYVYNKYNLVFCPKNKCIIGCANHVGGFYPLDINGVKLCEKLKLKYEVINDQKTF